MRRGLGLLVLLMLPMAQAGPYIDPSSCTPGAEFDFTTDRMDVQEFEGNFSVNITRSGTYTMIDCSEDVFVRILPHDQRNSATSGQDYKAAYIPVHFAGQQKEATTQITIIDDAIDEDDEWFILELDHFDEDAIGSQDEIEVKIIDDSGGFRFTRVSQMFPLGNDGASVRVERIGETVQAISASIEVRQPNRNASALADVDIRSVSFAAGQTSSDIEIVLNNSTSYERRATLRLYNPIPSVSSFIGSPSKLLLAEEVDPNKIDPEGAVVAYSGPVFRVDESEGGVIIEVTRTGNMTREFTVNYTTEPGKAGQDEFSAASGTLSFGPGQAKKTFVVSIIDDDLPEGPESIWIRLFGAVGAQTGPLAAATIVIIDDDQPEATTTTTTPAEESPALPATILLMVLVALAVQRRR